jgi:hypothetical protein
MTFSKAADRPIITMRKPSLKERLRQFDEKTARISELTDKKYPLGKLAHDSVTAAEAHRSLAQAFEEARKLIIKHRESLMKGQIPKELQLTHEEIARQTETPLSKWAKHIMRGGVAFHVLYAIHPQRPSSYFHL